MFHFVLAVLATWRVTHLLASEDGPGDIVVRLRARLGTSLLGRMIDCFQCLSLWIAAVFAVFVSMQWDEWLLAWLALSGGACLLERLGDEPVVIQQFSESAEEKKDVLRSETIPVAGNTEPGGSPGGSSRGGA